MDDIQTESLPVELEKLTNLLDTRPECLATGDSEIAQAALDAAKYIFDLCMVPFHPHLASYGHLSPI